MFRSMWCNIRKWRNNYRVYIAFLAVAVFTYIRSDSIKNYAALKGLSVTPFFFTFQMDDSITRMLFYFGIILLLCNAPFIDEHQLFTLSRLGRKKWFCGQILYILLANVIYFAWMFFVSIIVFIPWVAPSAKWGDIWINLSHNPALAGVVLHEEAIKEAITEHIEHVEKDLATIRAMESEFEDKGLEKYKITLELSDAIGSMNQYQEQLRW